MKPLGIVLLACALKSKLQVNYLKASLSHPSPPISVKMMFPGSNVMSFSYSVLRILTAKHVDLAI